MCLVFPGLCCVSFVPFWFFNGNSAPYSLSFLGHSLLTCPWCYLVRFLNALQALPGALALISPYRGDPLLWKISMASQTNWTCRPCVDRGGVPQPCHWFLLEALLGLIKARVELSRLGCPAVDISSYQQTGYIGWRSCWNPFITSIAKRWIQLAIYNRNNLLLGCYLLFTLSSKYYLLLKVEKLYQELSALVICLKSDLGISPKYFMY